jgi:hypothetical protein
MFLIKYLIKMGNPESKIKQDIPKASSKSVSNLSILTARRFECLTNKSPRNEPKDKLKPLKREYFLQKLNKQILSIISKLNSSSITEKLSKDTNLGLLSSFNISNLSEKKELIKDQVCNNISYTNSYLDSFNNDRGFKIYKLGLNKFNLSSLDIETEQTNTMKVLKVPLSKDSSPLLSNNKSPERTPEVNIQTTPENETPIIFSKKKINSNKSSISNNSAVKSLPVDNSRNNLSVSNIPLDKSMISRTSPKRTQEKSKEKAIVKLTLKELKDITTKIDTSQYNSNQVYSKKKISISETPKNDSTYSTVNSSKFIDFNAISNRDRSPTDKSSGYVSKLRQKNEYKIIQDQKDTKSRLNKSVLEPTNRNLNKKVSANNSFTGDYLQTDGNMKTKAETDEKFFDKFNEKFNEKFTKSNKIILNNIKVKSSSPKRVNTSPSLKKVDPLPRTSFGTNKPKPNVPLPRPVKQKESAKEVSKETPNYWTKMKSKEILSERNKSTEPKKVIKIDLAELSDDGNIFEVNPQREENKAKLNKIKNKPSINDQSGSNEYRSKTPIVREAYSIENYLEDERMSLKKGTPKFEAKRATFGKIDDISNYMSSDYPDRFSFNMLAKKVKSSNIRQAPKV